MLWHLQKWCITASRFGATQWRSQRGHSTQYRREPHSFGTIPDWGGAKSISWNGSEGVRLSLRPSATPSSSYTTGATGAKGQHNEWMCEWTTQCVCEPAVFTKTFHKDLTETFVKWALQGPFFLSWYSSKWYWCCYCFAPFEAPDVLWRPDKIQNLIWINYSEDS